MRIRNVVAAALALLGFSAHADSFTPGGTGVLTDGRIVEEGQASFDPGSGDPWHYHPGDLWVIVLSGELTEERGCGTTPVVYRAGSAFHEPAGIVHQVTNTGTVPAVIIFSGVLPACFTNFNDQISVDGPYCTSDGDSSHEGKDEDLSVAPVPGPYACPL